MPSQPNDIEDLQGLRDEREGLSRQLSDLYVAHKYAEAEPLEERRRQISDALRSQERQLRRQIADLRKASKYAEAVPLAERVAQAVEVRWSSIRRSPYRLGGTAHCR